MIASVLLFCVVAGVVQSQAQATVALQPVNPSDTSATGEIWSAESLFGRTLAQATCTGLMRSAGAAYAVRRECNAEASDCHSVCKNIVQGKNVVDPTGGAVPTPKYQCENSIHISNGEGGDLPGQLGLRTFRYNSCRVKGCGPNYCCCSQVAKSRFMVRTSCRAILRAKESLGSGIYLINPSGVADGAFKVYCDMTTDGGGWTLFGAYNHKAGENAALVEGVVPTDVETSYSHINLSNKGFIEPDVKEIRFYCETSAHSRRIHFSTKNDQVVLSALKDRGVLEADSFRRGAKLLQGHTANLPGSTTATGASSLLEDTFFDGDAHAWSVRPDNNDFKCDDNGGANVRSRHLLFFR